MASPLESELYAIEEELAGGTGEEYRRHLAADAIVIVPTQALSKDETATAMDESPGWSETSITERRLLEPADGVAILTYRFRGRRGEDFSYEALMTSVYVRDGETWRLRLHQQTPVI